MNLRQNDQTIMSKKKRRFTAQFKADAVELLRASNKPLIEVAKELGIGHSTLCIWNQKFLHESKAKDEGAVGDRSEGVASGQELLDENRRLRLEVAHLKRQREILKKAASILAEDPQLDMR